MVAIFYSVFTPEKENITLYLHEGYMIYTYGVLPVD